jgi:hypothetical protein
MGKYIQQFVSDFSPAQRRALEDLVQRSRDGSTINLDEVNAIAESLDSGVERVFQIPTFTQDIIDGCLITTALESIRIDLTTAYSQLRTLESTMRARNDVHGSDLLKLQQSLLSIEEQILSNRYRRLNDQYTEVKYVDFATTVNETTLPNRAILEDDTGQVSAGRIRKLQYLTRTGVLRPRFETTVLVEGWNPDRDLLFNKDESASKDPLSVWAEILLTDSTVHSVYEGEVYDGAVVLFDVHLPQMERWNEVKLGGFGRFEPTLIKLQYLDGEQWIDVPNVQDVRLISSTQAIRFDPVDSRSLRLVLHQNEYIFNDFALSRSQIKRTHWLNLAIEGVKQSALASDGILPSNVKDERLARASEALKRQLEDTDADTPLEKYATAITTVLDHESEDLVTIRKFEYVLGLRQLELNYNRYFDGSEYKTPKLRALGSVFELTLEINDSHSPNLTSAKYWLDLGGGRELPLLPEGTDRVQGERLNFDSNRTARTRFKTTGTPDITVRRNGDPLPSSAFTVVAVNNQTAAITIASEAWTAVDKYSVSYDVSPSQSTVRVLDMFDSIKTGTREYRGTERNNRLSLPSHPFVLKEITLDTRRWSRPDPRDARWSYRGAVERTDADDDPYVIRMDGENYGTHPVVEVAILDVAVNATMIDIELPSAGNTENAFPPQGTIRLGDELMYYTEYTSTGVGTARLSGVIRGYNNTAQAEHTIGTDVIWQTDEFYEPILIKVNGARSINRTDYKNFQHPAFSDVEGPPEYVQIGSNIYFDRPISGLIEVEYHRLVDYISVRCRLHDDSPSNEYTSTVDSFIMKLNTSTL